MSISQLPSSSMDNSPTSSLELTMAMPGSGETIRIHTVDMNRMFPEEHESTEEDEDDNDESLSPMRPRKKLRLSKEQARLLEDTFKTNQTLNPKEKEELARQLSLTTRQVEVWFQNHRARCKLKQTEMEYEYLKRWFGSLTEQNQRLQKEVHHLRAMKASSSSSPENHDLLLSSSLTMCPNCKRVTSSLPRVVQRPHCWSMPSSSCHN